MIFATSFTPINIIWGVLIVATVIIELTTQELDCIWFTAGAIVALILSLIGVESIIIQVVVFAVVSCILLFTVGKWAGKKLQSHNIPTNVDAIIGQEIVITKKTDYFNHGEGKYNGLTWTIACEKGLTFTEGEIAIVERVEGNKLIVKKDN